jgi:hypothetical protein
MASMHAWLGELAGTTYLKVVERVVVRPALDVPQHGGLRGQDLLL